jgi:hypothetical protein
VLPQSILTCLLLLAAITSARPAGESASKLDSPVLLYTVAKSYDPLAWMHAADRFSPDARIFLRDDNGPHAFLPDFAESADPAVSFDGERVLFAGKTHRQDPWQIWEVPIAGGQPRRITSGSEDCIRPLYLPDDRVVYSRKVAGHFMIEAADLSGGKPLALTYGPANFLPTDILHDGRILFEAGYPLGSATTPEIYTVYSDGSGVESYRCDHGKARYSGRQVSSGDIIFASEDGLSRFTSARAQAIPITVPPGEYAGDIVETASGNWLISWRHDHESLFQMMQWTSGTKQLQTIVTEHDAAIVQPTLLASHAVPNRHPSGLHDWPNANLLCLNAYTSKYGLAPGSIHSVRLYTRNSNGNPKLLGTAPVERDGSFFVQVPSEQPLQVELLDATGKTLKREAGYWWMRRGEQRGCVGCHAGPETAPENAVPMILLKSTTPADMTGATSQTAAGGR